MCLLEVQLLPRLPANFWLCCFNSILLAILQRNVVYVCYSMYVCMLIQQCIFAQRGARRSISRVLV